MSRSVADSRTRASGLRLEWKIKEQWSAWAQLTEGTYIQLSQAQAALLDRLGLELPRRLRQPLPAEM